ncbi:hypothetical protein AP1_0174 [Aeromonas phage AP1]|uniref:Uncharacterized protein n=3 Tax=Caudoviricetes TaxID=2731619 RepID=A0A291LCW6_9CAUD|nr:hypothetical protein [Aeromonas phage AS-szw]QAX97685.1 hypothetical protein ASswx1_39 [Aeromonas phage Asswx_1]QAX98870.1 hypothetical protein assk_71 [Aeromonas phage Assk]QMV28881.1 hypothetical protein AP1_0174 [Aeromonas phage AP1]
MMSKDEAMEKAFYELLEMDDEYFELRLKETIAQGGVFQKMAEDGFVPSLVSEKDDPHVF